MKKSNVKRKSRPLSISFEESTYKALSQAAAEEDIPFSTYVKAAALNYTKASIEHNQLLAAINPGDQNEGQKTFNEAITDLREVLNHTLVNSAETMGKRLDRVERLVRRMIYAQLYYSREIPPDGRSTAQISAKTRMQQLLKDIDTEPIEG